MSDRTYVVGRSGRDDLARDDPEIVRAFIDFLDGKDPKTIATYRATLRRFVAWLATMPGGDPFRMELATGAAICGYLESLKAAGQAPRTQAKAITALQHFCRWAQDEGLLRRNPVAQQEFSRVFKRWLRSPISAMKTTAGAFIIP